MKNLEMRVVCERLGLDEETLVSWIECRLIEPIDADGPYFDMEDFSRIRFIVDLKRTYNTNNESLEIIMHLVDQLHNLTAEARVARTKLFKDS